MDFSGKRVSSLMAVMAALFAKKIFSPHVARMTTKT